MNQKAIIGAFALFIITSVVFFLFLLKYERGLTPHGGGPYTVLTAIPDPEAVPPFQFTDHDGAPFGTADLQGGWTLLFFGFTNCPDICPPTMAQLKTFMDRLGGQAPTPRVVFVSVDPERDPPPVLKRYVTSFHPDFLGIVGPRPALVSLAKELGIYAETVPGPSAMSHAESHSDQAEEHAHQGHDAPSEDYVINHSGYILVIDPQGRYVGVFSPPLNDEEMAAAWRNFTR